MLSDTERDLGPLQLMALRDLKRKWPAIEWTILGTACVLVFCGVLTAGLWPFFPPKNHVRWLKNQQGLLFGDYATVFSSGRLNLDATGPDCALELWLQPQL